MLEIVALSLHIQTAQRNPRFLRIVNIVNLWIEVNKHLFGFVLLVAGFATLEFGVHAHVEIFQMLSIDAFTPLGMGSFVL